MTPTPSNVTPQTRGSRLWRKLSLALIAFLVSLPVADLLLRPVMSPWLYYREQERFIQRDPRRPYLARYEPKAHFRGTVYGDLAAFSGRRDLRHPRTVEFYTDRFGFQNADGALTNEFAVIALGDSFGAGLGTTQEKIWPVMLEKLCDLPVYNLSMLGSPWCHCMNLQLMAPRLRLKPGAVVLLMLFGGNDLDEFYSRANRPDDVPVNSWWQAWRVSFSTFVNRSPLKMMERNARERRKTGGLVVIKTMSDGREVAFFNNYVLTSSRTCDDVLTHPACGKFELTLLRIKEFCATSGLNLRIVIMPAKEEVYGWILRDEKVPAPAVPSAFGEVVSGFCASNRIPCLDLTVPLSLEAVRSFQESGQFLYWEDDTHLSEQGHEVVARELCSFLQAR